MILNFAKENIIRICKKNIEFTFYLFIFSILLINKNLEDAYNIPKIFIGSLILMFGYINFFTILYLQKTFKLNIPFIIFTVLFFVFTGLNFIFSIDKFVFFELYSLYLMIYFIIFLYIHSEKTEQFKTKLIYVIMFISFILSMYGILQYNGIYIIEGSQKLTRIYSLIGNPNYLADILAMLVPVTFYYIIVSPHFSKIILIICNISNIYCLWLTQTRGAIFSILLSVLVFIIYYTIQLRKIKTAIVSVSLIMLLIIGVISAGGTRFDIFNYANDGSVRNRIITIWSGIEEWRMHPVFGIGLENYQTLLPIVSTRLKELIGITLPSQERRTHNELIQFLAETGIIFTGLLILLLTILYIKLFENMTFKKLFYVIGISAIILHTLVHFPFHIYSSIIIWCFLVLLIIRFDFKEYSININIANTITIILSIIITGLFVYNTVRVKASYYNRYGRFYREHGDPSLSSKRNWTLSLSYYNMASRYFPEKITYHYIGTAHYQLFNYDKAIDYFQKAYNRHLYQEFLFTNWGNALVETNRTLEGIHIYNLIKYINKKFPVLYYNIANAYSNLGMTKKSLENYKKAIELDPEYLDAHYNLGNLYYNLDKYDLAIQSFKNTIKLNPDFIKAYNNLGLVYYTNENYDSAIYYYGKTISMDKDYFNGYLGLLETYIKLGLDKKLEGLGKFLISKFPDKYQTYFHLGNYYVLHKKYQKAEMFYKKILNLNPQIKVRIYNNLGLVYYKMDKPQKAREMFLKAIAINPNYQEAKDNLRTISEPTQNIKGYDLFNKIFELMQENKFDEAFNKFRQNLEKKMFDKKIEALVYNKMGEIKYIQKDYNKSVYFFNKGINLGYYDDVTFNDLGNIYFNSNNYDSALYYYKKCVELNDEYALAYYNLGSTYYKLGNLELSYKNYKIAAETDKNNPEFKRMLDQFLQTFPQYH